MTYLSYSLNLSYHDFFNLMLDVQPSYLNVDIDWLVKFYSKFDEWEDEKNRKRWLKKRIKEDFKFLKNPPDWIQNPDWIVDDNGPYVFMGQISLQGLFQGLVRALDKV